MALAEFAHLALITDVNLVNSEKYETLETDRQTDSLTHSLLRLTS